MAKTINARIALKSDTSSQWQESTLSALKGEYLFDSDTHYIKVGDGIHTWNELSTIRLPKDAIDNLQEVDTNTVFKFSEVSDNTLTLLSADGTKEITDNSWNTVSTFKVDLSSEISSIASAYMEVEKTRAIDVESRLADAIDALAHINVNPLSGLVYDLAEEGAFTKLLIDVGKALCATILNEPNTIYIPNNTLIN